MRAWRRGNAHPIGRPDPVSLGIGPRADIQKIGSMSLPVGLTKKRPPGWRSAMPRLRQQRAVAWSHIKSSQSFKH
ncbi:unnamed protein product [Merluccius merluccius]